LPINDDKIRQTSVFFNKVGRCIRFPGKEKPAGQTTDGLIGANSKGPKAWLFFVGEPAGEVLELGIESGGGGDNFAVGVAGFGHQPVEGLAETVYLLLHCPESGHFR
jgi:hypothetical protein